MSSGPSAADGANGPPGDMTQDYESLQVIGKGSFGTVYKATRKSDRAQVVVKEVIITSLNEAERRCALQEASTLSKLQHENIIQYHETRSAEGTLVGEYQRMLHRVAVQHLDAKQPADARPMLQGNCAS